MPSPNTQPPIIALVGRVNVGKSTLFNKLIGRHEALTSPIPGTTRDRREATLTWREQSMTLIDTGGVEVPRHNESKKKREGVNFLVTKQTNEALKRADLALLITSAIDGVLPQDREWAESLRGRIPTILVVNKVDSAKRETEVPNFHILGLDKPEAVSALSGRSTGDLLDTIIDTLKKIPLKRRPAKKLKNADTPPLNLAILGQPNSGKSSLLNAILGEERVITSPKPHTTREPQDISFTYYGQKINLIDTAGIRRRHQRTTGLESAGIATSLKTVERANVVCLVIDVTREPTFQDQRLARMITDTGRGLILVANKWDLITAKDAKTAKQTEQKFRQMLPGLNWAPLMFVSAKTKLRVRNLLDMAREIVTASQQTLDEVALTAFLEKTSRQHRPARGKGVRHPSVLSFKQTGTNPPRFILTIQGEIHPSYLKFIENRLRESFNLTGTPIHISLKETRKRIHKKK